MTAEEWAQCTNPRPMLDSLQGQASDRQARLLLFECFRALYQRHWSQSVGVSLDRMEHFSATGQGLTIDQLLEVAGRVFHHAPAGRDNLLELALLLFDAIDALLVPPGDPTIAAGKAGDWPLPFSGWGPVVEWMNDRFSWVVDAADQEAVCAIVRDLFRNPFLTPLHIDPFVTAWHDGVVVKLAQAASEERILPAGTLAPNRIAVLADALEDAGGADEFVAHLRTSATHWRGCHVLDAILLRH